MGFTAADALSAQERLNAGMLKGLRENTNRTPGFPDHEPQRKAPLPLERCPSGPAEDDNRVRIRFIGYRVRPLDPDSFAGSCKALLDCARRAALIPGDEPWKIIFETEQVRVRHFKEEKTVIEVEVP